MENYNGWTNYATWRINLEILGDMEFEEPVDASELEDIVSTFVFDGLESGLIADYASAFINQVNFYEIAESINENNKL
jgi:hypothetical protein